MKKVRTFTNHPKTITFDGIEYAYKMVWGNGAYYVSDHGYILTNSEHEVDYMSLHAKE